MVAGVNTVGSRFVRMFGRHLSEAGVTLAPLLVATGLDPAILDAPEADVPINTFARLMEAAAEIAEKPCLGLEFAQSYPLGGTGLLGYAIMHSRTVRDALIHSARYANLVMLPIDPRVSFEQQGGRETGEYSWSWPPWLDAGTSQYRTFMAALLVRRMRSGTARPWSPLAVALEAREPRCRDLAHDIFGNGVTFNAPRNSIVVDGHDLDIAYTVADHRLLAIIKAQGDRLLADLPQRGDLVHEVRSAILDRLGKGEVTLEAIAARINVPPRTLQARLAQQSGMSYEAVLGEARQDLARHYLAETDLNLTEIALILGYSELSAFTRASQRWFGVPPSAMRQKLRA